MSPARSQDAIAASSTDEFALPLVVAVTGHRDLLDSEIEAIRTRVRSFLQELRDRYPANRLVVLSALAEGADLLVAEVAVELAIELIVPLPKPREIYLRGFTSEAAKQRFATLCTSASQVFELPSSKPPVPEEFSASDWERDYPYAQLGVYLSAHCHIFIAIWDGKPSHHLGGTAQVVKFHHDDVMPGLTSNTATSQQMLVDDESDLVFHIVCSRDREDSTPHADFTALDWFWYTKDEECPRSKELPTQHELIFRRSAEFSEDATRMAAEIELGKYSLLEDSQHADLPEGIENVDHFFYIADFLAIFYQRKTVRTLLITHVLAFLMGMMFIFYSDLESMRIFLLAFLGFFAAALLTNVLAKRGSWQRKYLDYRTLAEGLRVQFYWAAAGASADNKWKFTHDSFLQSQDPEFGWIRNVMRVAGFRCDAENKQSSSGLDFTLQQWVGNFSEGQLSYFQRKTHDRIKKSKLTRLLGIISLVTSIVIVFIFLVFGPSLPGLASNVLMVTMAGALLGFGVREGYAYATAEKELIKQYEYMLGIYSNAQRRLAEADDDAEKRQILLALGQSALNEHSDWLLMHRERSLDEGEIWRMDS